MVPDDISNCQTGSKNPYIWFSAQKNERPSYPILMRSKVRYWLGTPNSLRKGFQSDSICIKETASGLQLSLFFKQIMFWLGRLFVFAGITSFLIENRDVDNILSQKFKLSSPHILELFICKKIDFTSTFWIANCPYWWDVFGALIDLNPHNASPRFRLKLTNCLFAWFSMKSYRFQLTKHWFVQQKLFLSSKWNRNWTKFNNPRLRLKGGQISQVILLDV